MRYAAFPVFSPRKAVCDFVVARVAGEHSLIRHRLWPTLGIEAGWLFDCVLIFLFDAGEHSLQVRH
jgi:hypothetical protein